MIKSHPTIRGLPHFFDILHVPSPWHAEDELDTPAACPIDLDRISQNAEAAAICRQHGVAWRPHAKVS